MPIFKSVKKSLILLLLGLLIGFLVQGIYSAKSPYSAEEVIFTIEKGQSSRQIAFNLEKENIIRWGPFFRIYAAVKGVSGKLQTGHYRLFPSMTIPQITSKLVRGETAKIIVTIPEGFTQKQIEEKLNLKLDGENLEGFLFPDTYEFAFGVSGKEAAKIMQDNFEKKLTADLREEIEKQNKAILQIVIMASLIEKEVKTKEDKELVSGVLWKRLGVGMPLQVDAEMWTYQNRGLPPQPIANPGLESIKAAISPRASPYWYYLSTPDSKTIFSKTLEGHNLARAKYLDR